MAVEHVANGVAIGTGAVAVAAAAQVVNSGAWRQGAMEAMRSARHIIELYKHRPGVAVGLALGLFGGTSAGLEIGQHVALVLLFMTIGYFVDLAREPRA
jgi:hypothetical protein